MNKLFVGFSKQVGIPEIRLAGYSVRRQGLYIADEVPEIRGAMIFDPAIQQQKARTIADVL